MAMRISAVVDGRNFNIANSRSSYWWHVALVALYFIHFATETATPNLTIASTTAMAKAWIFLRWTTTCTFAQEEIEEHKQRVDDVVQNHKIRPRKEH